MAYDRSIETRATHNACNEKLCVSLQAYTDTQTHNFATSILSISHLPDLCKEYAQRQGKMQERLDTCALLNGKSNISLYVLEHRNTMAERA